MRVAAVVLGVTGLAAMLSGVPAQSGAAAPGKAAVAAPTAPASGPVSPEPATTSASYGDWVLRCQRIGEADKAKKFCEVAENIQLPNQQGLVAQVALGHLPGESALHLTAVLPPSVSFPSTVTFTSGEQGHGSMELQWRRCLSGGCFADAIVSDDALKVWRLATDPGKLTFKDAAVRDVALPVSFRGLAQALDALAKS